MATDWLSVLKRMEPPPQAEPTAPAEVFTAPAECWQCRNRYQCDTCPHRLKKPLVIGRRYGKGLDVVHKNPSTVAVSKGDIKTN